MKSATYAEIVLLIWGYARRGRDPKTREKDEAVESSLTLICPNISQTP